MDITAIGIKAIERGIAPDRLTRLAIRALCRRRLAEVGGHEGLRAMREFVATMRQGKIARQTELANEQHYEVPAEFFRRVLGPRLKYSCCHFEDANATLANAEESALALTCTRAELADGQRILELGCGWGSLAIWMAENFPGSCITSVSNSHSQREFIENQCANRGISNLNVITADMNDFDPGDKKFDRVVSVEMFEHMRNWQLLLSRISAWLRGDGRLFVHIFCHATHLYPFQTEGTGNWMGRNFFSGGIMPNANIFDYFSQHLVVEKQYNLNGRHYTRTLEAWLARMDSQRAPILDLFATVYGNVQAGIWFNRWRMFFMSCAELFAYKDGREWFVAQYLLNSVSDSG